VEVIRINHKLCFTGETECAYCAVRNASLYASQVSAGYRMFSRQLSDFCLSCLSCWDLMKLRPLHKSQERPAAYSDTLCCFYVWELYWQCGRETVLQLATTQSHLCAGVVSCTSWHIVRTQSHLCADGVSCTPWHTVSF